MSIQLTFTPANKEVPLGVNSPIVIESNRNLDLRNLESCIHIFGPDFTIAQNLTMANSIAYDKQPFSKALRSGGFQGEVEYQIKVESEQLPDSPETETGNKIYIYPIGSWAEHTDFVLYVSGGEDVIKDSVIRTISIYNQTPLQMSRGQLILEGEYTGNQEDVLLINITRGGRANEVEFSWNFLEGPGGEVSSSSKLKDDVVHTLSLGISVRILTDEDQLIIDGDFTSAYVKKPDLLESTIKYEFKTASNEVIEAPSITDSSSSPLGLTIGGLSNNFELVNSSPKNEASNIPVDRRLIVLQFSENVDPSSVNSKTIKITSTSADGTSDTVEVPASFVVEGNRVFIKLEVD